MTRASLAGLVVLAATACVSTPAPGERASVLVSTDQIEGDFVLRQHLRFRVGDGGGAMEAVVQRLCGELTVIVLTPLGLPAISIRQRGLDISVQTHLASPWPFPAENVLLDVHRVYFLPLRVPPGDGTYTHRIGGESVEERWESGRLLERIFSSSRDAGRVVITYPDGATPGGPAPREARLRNERLGYDLYVLTVEERRLRCESPID